MLKISAVLYLLSAFIAFGKCQQKPYAKFEDTITAVNKVIFKARMIGVESENFAFAVCEESGPYFDFKPRHCNVTIQREARKRTCPVYIAPDDGATIHLSDLIFYPLGDDKVIIAWRNIIDFGKEASELKILEISTCQLVDVPVPTDQVIYVAVYKNAADLGFWNKTYCRSGHCKVTINSDGKQISGPIDILKDVDVAFHDPLGPVNANSPDQGFYMTVGWKSEFNHGKSDEHFYKINGQGKSVLFHTFEGAEYARPSTNNGLFSFCYTAGHKNTTIVCVQYDGSLKLKLNATLEFEDGQFRRWLQPYNLKKGGLLLVTGKASDVEGKHYDTFSIIKIRQDGQKDQAVEFKNLNFTCPLITSMYVKIMENDSGEICAHFTCTNKEQGIYALQLAVKCLSKA